MRDRARVLWGAPRAPCPCMHDHQPRTHMEGTAALSAPPCRNSKIIFLSSLGSTNGRHVCPVQSGLARIYRFLRAYQGQYGLPAELSPAAVSEKGARIRPTAMLRTASSCR